MIGNAFGCISSCLVFVLGIFAYFIEKDSAPSLVGSNSLHWMMTTDIWMQGGQRRKFDLGGPRRPPYLASLSSSLLPSCLCKLTSAVDDSSFKTPSSQNMGICGYG